MKNLALSKLDGFAVNLKAYDSVVIVLLFLSANVTSFFISLNHALAMLAASLVMMYHMDLMPWLGALVATITCVVILAAADPDAFYVLLVHVLFFAVSWWIEVPRG
ncbi:uncharacterized protein LOC106013347 [Aplysia californica]|uniref:Uncharacterized protein LOC106013347 n=1 Tax=Aplysia californica TaxID=6500 RepID=A0ABM1AB21_APLCA|nr:uncharacterized protein LOC106013347 [Aplysia californica]